MAPAAVAASKPASTPRNVSAVVDLVRSYLRDIGRVPLLTHEQEITLGRQVQDLMDLEALQNEIESRDGGRPSSDQLAKASGLTSVQLKRKLQHGRRAKERMVAANLRLVVSVAKKYTKRNMELLDLIQRAPLVWCRAWRNLIPPAVTNSPPMPIGGSVRASLGRLREGRTIRLPIHITEMLNKLKKGQRG